MHIILYDPFRDAREASITIACSLVLDRDMTFCSSLNYFMRAKPLEPISTVISLFCNWT